MSDRTESAAVETELNRDIGIVGAVALGVGTMIAAGIFVLSGLAVGNVGAMAIASFLVAAVVASFTAFAYAEFAAIYPESGGGYAYVANTFDTDLTYIVGWSMILGYPASAAFYLASFSNWFYEFVYPALSIPRAIPFWVSGLVILGLLVALNLKGTEESGQFQVVVTAAKVALILLFLFGGLRAFDLSAISTSVAENTETLQDLRNVGLTSALVFITFFGFEAIATNAEEIEEPGRNVPRAIFVSMGLVTVVYSLVVVVIVLAVQDPQFLDFLATQADLAGLTPAAFVERRGEVSMAFAAKYYLGFLGNAGFWVIIVGALFSMLSAANATILAGSRVKLAMSRRGHLPPGYEELHPRFETPHRSVLLTGGLILFFIVFFTVVFGGGPGSEAAVHLPFAVPLVGSELRLGIESIAHFADFMLLSGLVAVNVAVVRSRQKFDIDRAFEVPGVPVVPAVAVLANLVLLVNVEPSSFLLGVIAELVGAVLWVGYVGEPSEERIERETPTAVQTRSHGERDYRIVVPIANPDHVPQLMRTADDLATANDGEVHVTSVVTLPEQTPLSEGYQYVDERREVLERAMDFARERDLPVSGSVRIGHHPGNAIVNTVRQYDADAVLMGWSGTPRRRDIVVGSTVDEVVQEASCDVLVERIGVDATGEAESILLPTAGGPHAEFAGAVATAIARAEGAMVTVVHVVPTDVSEAERQHARSIVDEAATAVRDEAGVETEAVVLDGEDVVETLVERTGEYDLTVVGASREGLLQEFVFGAVPEAVARRADSTIVMAKRDLGVTSRLRRWLHWE